MTVSRNLDHALEKVPFLGRTGTDGHTVSVERVLDQPLASIAATLADASTYAEWVVGAKEIRDWEESWPLPGSTFHHTQGASFANIKDTTSVLQRVGERRLVLEVRARPLLVARTTFELTAVDADATRVTLTETPTAGILRRIDNPALWLAVKLRNHETLRRLARVSAQR
jgi:hypothetical protein